MHTQPTRRYSADEIARIEAEVRGLRDIKRLLSSGAGGIAQLKRVTQEKLSAAEDRLALAITYSADEQV